MVNQWHYNRDGQQEGPISDSELRKLANDGTLKTEDLTWKEGMAEWRKAGSMKGLFQKSSASTPPPLPSSATISADLEHAASSQKKAGATFGGSAKLAGQLTAKQTELTKIQQVSLPGQYVVVGSQAFEEGSQRNEHKSLFAEIERLNNTISELEKSSANQPEAKTFTDKAMALGGKAVTSTKLKAVQLQRRQKYIHLGKSIFESGKTPIGCEQQSAEIERLLARAGELRSFFSSNAVVALFAIFFAPIGLFLIWRHPTWSKGAKFKWAGASMGCFLFFGILLTLANEPGEVLPSGAKAETRSRVGKEPTLWVEEAGYVLPSGEFVNHGKKLVWRGPDKKNLLSETPYLNGEVHGVMTMWHKNGKMAVRYISVNGIMQGLYEAWYESGQLSKRHNVLDGKVHGKFETWFENGQLSESSTLVEDLFHGRVVEYFQDGTKKAEKHYDHGQKHGVFREFSETGQLVSESEFVNVIPSALPNDKAGDDEIIDAMARLAVGVISKNDSWGVATPEDFNDLMQTAAGELANAGQATARPLRNINPSSTKEVQSGSNQGRLVKYGDVSCSFIRNPRSGKYLIFSVTIGEEEYSMVGIGSRR